MIDRLKGTIEECGSGFVSLMIEGTGMQVKAQVTHPTFCNQDGVGAKTILWCREVLKEDHRLLFGFSDLDERTMFDHLLKINGVGAKMAIGILSFVAPSDLMRLAKEKLAGPLQTVPGVGKALSVRVVAELNMNYEKIEKSLSGESGSRGRYEADKSYQTIEGAVQAMTALGFNLKESRKVAEKNYQPDDSEKELITKCLAAMRK